MKKQEEKLEQMESRLIDVFNQAIIASRDSVPGSMSAIILELKQSIDEVKAAQEKHVDTHAINDKKINGILDEILTQAKKTNGRVSKLETWRVGMEGFSKGLKAGSKGVWVSVVTFFGVIAYIFGDILKRKIGL